MKKIIILLTVFCVAAFSQEKGAFTDSRDGKEYKTVKIGTQTWMAENLNYKPESGDNQCYKDMSKNCDKYGRLYRVSSLDKNKYAIKNKYNVRAEEYAVYVVCPDGWSLPNDTEWEKLMDFVGGISTAGTKLKAASGWDNRFSSYRAGTDDFGFSALPGGYASTYAEQRGYWYSRSEKVFSMQFDKEEMFVYKISRMTVNHEINENSFVSVRCIKD